MVNNAQKVVSTIEIDDAPRLSVVKNNGHKVESKSNSNIIAKKEKKQVKIRKKGKKGSCEYCSGNVKFRANRNIIHINISQNPTHHYFCSKENFWPPTLASAINPPLI